MQQLPIHEIIPDIKQSFIKLNKLILQAPPGAGKSTIVPIAFLNEEWLENKVIIMLESRRVAARMVATQMAKLLGEEVGQSVGYQIKMDNCTSKQTKIIVVTEAILVQKLQNNQSLDEVAMIIFDEFHERSIHTDLSLALSLEVQALIREDLKLLIMSATLNSEALLNLLGDVPVLTSKGKLYEVETVYLNESINQPNYKSMSRIVVDTIHESLKNDEGDILVFLPGTKEIKRVQKLLFEEQKDKSILILPLYSTLNKKEQDQAIQKNSQRKVILSTNIAQTSLTIEGVRVVIDSGLEKLSVYNYSNGMNHLELSFISKESAIQRAGRAGRLSHGKCYRLWHKKKILQPSTKPEILRSDLSDFILHTALWGADTLDDLALLDIPDDNVIASAKEVLHELHMLDDSMAITDFGKHAIALGVHARFAYMILKANELNFAYEACLLTTLLNNKDILKDNRNRSDIRVHFKALYEKSYDDSGISSYALKEVLKQSETLYLKLKRMNPAKKHNGFFTDESLAHLLLLAYPDRLAKQRANEDNRYKLSNGKGAVINNEDELFNEPLLVVASLHAHNKESFIQLALPIDMKTIHSCFLDALKQEESITYNKNKQRLDSKLSTNFLKLELYSNPILIQKNENMKSLLINLIRKEGLILLNLTEKTEELRARVNFLVKQQASGFKSDFTSMSDDVLMNTLEIWLKPYLDNCSTIKQLQKLDIHMILLSSLSWEQQQRLEEFLPTHFKVPSGSNIKIDYSDDEVPILAVKIQELFGLHNTPTVCNNRVPLQVHLLTPALRPIQITYDLKSFWDNSYSEIRKELRGKYKKHYWPEDPYAAIATKKTKKKM